MTNKLYCSPRRLRQAIKAARLSSWAAVVVTVCALGLAGSARGADAPQWMHAVVNAPLPAHDEKTDAVLLYSEDIVNVQGNGKIKSIERRVYKILRPGGREHGTVLAHYDSETRITGIRAWCIPAQGKDYEVKDKDASELAIPHVEGSDLINDVRAKFLNIPASNPGSIIGYEYEIEEQPLVLQDAWTFQESTVSASSRGSTSTSRIP